MPDWRLICNFCHREAFPKLEIHSEVEKNPAEVEVSQQGWTIRLINQASRLRACCNSTSGKLISCASSKRS